MTSITTGLIISKLYNNVCENNYLIWEISFLYHLTCIFYSCILCWKEATASYKSSSRSVGGRRMGDGSTLQCGAHEGIEAT